MEIEVGKYYRTADGRKVGPMKGVTFKWVKGCEGDAEWENDGRGIDGTPDLIEEWQDGPRLWKDLTDAEKGALLLAHHEGKVIERSFKPSITRELMRWMICPEGCLWDDNSSYRIKPEQKRETVELRSGGHLTSWEDYSDDYDTHRITFDLVDGEPDCASIKMEKL